MPRWPKTKRAKENSIAGTIFDDMDADDFGKRPKTSTSDQRSVDGIISENVVLTIDAHSYLDHIKVHRFNHFNRFLEIMKDYKSHDIDTPTVIDRVVTLFDRDPNLLRGFNTFLPPGYCIECSNDPWDLAAVRIKTPAGTIPTTSGVAAPLRIPDSNDPVAFNAAIHYVNKIKSRFADQPHIYLRYLEILRTYQRESSPVREIYIQIGELFKTAPDLVQEFKRFLPVNASGAVELIVSKEPKNMLFQFMEIEYPDLMRRSKIIPTAEVALFSHWTTGGRECIAYQGVVDSGASGDVFQVQTSSSG